MSLGADVLSYVLNAWLVENVPKLQLLLSEMGKQCTGYVCFSVLRKLNFAFQKESTLMIA